MGERGEERREGEEYALMAFQGAGHQDSPGPPQRRSGMTTGQHPCGV